MGTADEPIRDVWTSLLSLATSPRFMVLNPLYVLMSSTPEASCWVLS